MPRAFHQYSTELKQRLVEEIEGGHLSLREAARDAQSSVTMVQKWLDEYGRFRPKRDVVEVVMKSEQDRIAALEKALAEATLRVQVYDELITQANKHFKTDIKKNFGTPRLMPSARPTPVRPAPPSVRPSGSRATPTTNASAAAAPPATRTP
jgi:transposase